VIVQSLKQLWGLYLREVTRTYRNRAVLLMTFIQPVMWLVFFGSSLGNLPASFLNTFFHTNNYVAFLLPGELSTGMLFVGMFSSMSLIQDKRFGYLKRILVTKTPKAMVFLSKVFGATTRGLLQVPVMLATATLFGVRYPNDPVGFLETILAIVFLGLGLSSAYVMITMRSQDWQTPGVVSNFINLPLMFSSSALFPRSFFPGWMQYLSDVNPISYSANVGRSFVLEADPNFIYVLYLLIFATIMMSCGIVMSRRWLVAE
jgi:ABC-2 type transport system permease protein